MKGVVAGERIHVGAVGRSPADEQDAIYVPVDIGDACGIICDERLERTDDDGRVIPPEALDVIGADLESLYDTLDARDLSAGSPQARRLFS